MNENPRDKKKLSETDMRELSVRLINDNPEMKNAPYFINQLLTRVATAFEENKETISDFLEALKVWSFLPNHVIVHSQDRIDSGRLEKYPDELETLKEYRQKAIECYGVLCDKDASPDMLRTAAWEAIGAAYWIGLHLEPPDSFKVEIQNDLKNQAAANARQPLEQKSFARKEALKEAFFKIDPNPKRIASSEKSFHEHREALVRNIAPNLIDGNWPSLTAFKDALKKIKGQS